MPLRCIYFLIVVSTSVLLSCTPSPAPNQLEQIRERGVLRVGTTLSPTTYYLQQQRPAGLEYALAQRFASEIGVTLEMLPRYNSSDLFALLEQGEVDFIAASIDHTAQRARNYRFTPPYQQISHYVVYRQGSRLKPRDLSALDAELVVVADSSHAEWLQQQQLPELQWRASDEHDAVELLGLVMAGDIAYTIADSNILAFQRQLYPDLSIAFAIRDNLDVGWILKQQLDASLYDPLIKFFGQLRDSGELEQIVDQHFGHVSQFNYADTTQFIAAVETTLPSYRQQFQTHAGSLDWRLLAAISYQESLWKPRAEASNGRRGMMMLSLPAAQQVGVRSRLNPEQSIRGGARYFEQMLQRIPARIAEPDRVWFALAAYNIGLGHLEDARILTQQQGADPDRWIDVRKRLPLLRQKKFYRQSKYGFARGDEPVRYVGNIRRYYDTLIWLDERGLIPADPLTIELPSGSGDEEP